MNPPKTLAWAMGNRIVALLEMVAAHVDGDSTTAKARWSDAVQSEHDVRRISAERDKRWRGSNVVRIAEHAEVKAAAVASIERQKLAANDGSDE